MKNLDQLKGDSYNYFIEHYNNGGSSEFDKSINDISRDMIEAMKKETGECWMLKINRYSEDKFKPYMVKYEGQKVCNFEYGAIVQVHDEILENLLKAYKIGLYINIIADIKAILARIKTLQGILLSWS